MRVRSRRVRFRRCQPRRGALPASGPCQGSPGGPWRALPAPSPFIAQGNIYNALQDGDDRRSLISHLIAGSGNDTIVGNVLDNELTGNDGNDYLAGRDGNDRLDGVNGSDFLEGGDGDDLLLGVPVRTSCGRSGINILQGGAGRDFIEFGDGTDTLRDTWADMTSDVITGFDTGQSIDILGSLAGRSSLNVAYNEDFTSATLSAGGNSVRLFGEFEGGEFVSAARGMGYGCAHHDHLRQFPADPAGGRSGRSAFHQRRRQ